MIEKKDSKKVMFKSIGCRTNQEEFSELAATVSNQGYCVVTEPAAADIIMVNSCSVTAATESKTRRYLTTLSKNAPKARILVTGCLAQQMPDQLKKLKNVSWVLGNRYKDDCVSIIESGSEGIYHSAVSDGNNTILEIPSRTIRTPDVSFGKTRFSIKIQEGCDFRCAYCIVPFLRGPSRSASMEAIITTVKKAIDAGYKEIVLTGTHIGQYSELYGQGLINLLDKLIHIDGDFRIRLSSLDPRDCSDELLWCIGNEKKICNHLHVSLQSGSTRVLTSMGRSIQGGTQLFERLIDFRNANPQTGIGADIIVGFPGETEKDFLCTCELMKALQLSYIHVFRYSRRPGTPAACMAGQVSEIEKNIRSKKIREIVSLQRKKFIASMVHKPLRIIIESKSPARGLTSNYLHVEIDNTMVCYNSWCDVFITGQIKGRHCLAEPLKDKVA